MPLKYSTEITLALPRTKVVEIFQDPTQNRHWMEGFVSIETVEGEPGQVGSVSVLKIKMGKRELDMRETILANTLPEAFSTRYDCDGTRNEVHNRFITVSENETRWETDNVFEFGGVLMKVMGTLMPGMFKKQTMTYARCFKAWAEDGKSVANPS